MNNADQALEWHTETVLLQDLKDYSKNPRRMSKHDFEKLVKSLKEDGYHQRLLVNTDDTIIGGHQRKKALLAAGFAQDSTVEVLKPNRFLEEKDFQRLNIRDNLSYGEFDMDMIANEFEIVDLVAWDFDVDLFPKITEELQESEEKVEEKLKCELCGR